MKTISINLYSFSELSPEVQAKVLEKHRYTNTEFNDWHSFILEDWVQKLSGLGFPEAEIHFSDFYSQGYGACFDSEIDLTKLATEAERFILEPFEVSFAIEKTSFANYYSHAKTRFIEWDYGQTITPEAEQLAKAVCATIEKARLTYCKEIYKELQEQYEYLISDKAVEETIEANDWTFEIDGKMRNE